MGLGGVLQSVLNSLVLNQKRNPNATLNNQDGVQAIFPPQLAWSFLVAGSDKLFKTTNFFL